MGKLKKKNKTTSEIEKKIVGKRLNIERKKFLKNWKEKMAYKIEEKNGGNSQEKVARKMEKEQLNFQTKQMR